MSVHEEPHCLFISAYVVFCHMDASLLPVMDFLSWLPRTGLQSVLVCVHTASCRKIFLPSRSLYVCNFGMSCQIAFHEDSTGTTWNWAEGTSFFSVLRMGPEPSHIQDGLLPGAQPAALPRPALLLTLLEARSICVYAHLILLSLWSSRVAQPLWPCPLWGVCW